mgnify:CR=1 FL=1
MKLFSLKQRFFLYIEIDFQTIYKFNLMKALKRILAVCLFVGSLVVLAGFAAPNGNNAAGVQENMGCGLFDGYGNIVFADYDISIVNHGGNVTLICKAYDVPTPGYDVEFRAFGCGILDAWGNWWTTYNSFAAVDAYGNAMLRCQVKKAF